MCGIAGIINWQNDTQQDNSVRIKNMEYALDTMSSRGPDGRLVWQDKNVDLGHLRLAVIDLTLQAKQPMESTCGRYVITFNGEVYNFEAIKTEIGAGYSWQSESDTEVILASFIKFGPKCLDKFHGMFAFAIWDRIEEKLFVARDRVGVKPFYYHSSPKKFIFASRPSAIFKLDTALKKTPDRQALRYYLEAGYIPAPYSYYDSIRKLLPGHYMFIDNTGETTSCYWSLDSVETDLSLEKKSESMLIDELDRLIDKSVQLRMVSNVPLGAFLSGGIDSTLVVAYMKKHANAPVKTFTIGFDDKNFDESRHAQAVADYLNTEHTCESLSVDDLLSLMPRFFNEYDEPFFDYSAFPCMAVSRVARKHVTVSLSGDGGDEAFGGYHYYRILKSLSILQKYPKVIRRTISLFAGLLPGHKMRLLKRALREDSNINTFAFMRSVIKEHSCVMSAQLRADTQSFASLLELRAKSITKGISVSEMAMRLDAAYTLPDDYLQKIDLASMAFSLEAREPLLDHTILEWAAKLPDKWKIRGRTNKYLLRQLAYRYVPREILDRPKMGFGVPMATWLRGELKPWAEKLLSDKSAMTYLGLDAEAINKIWEKHQSNEWQAHSCLWTILVLLQFNQNERSENEYFN